MTPPEQTLPALGMKHDQPCRPSEADARGAASEREIALTARVAALELAVETLLSRELTSLGERDALMLKSDLLGKGGYISAEPEHDPREALRSATAVEMQAIVERASAL